MNGLLAGPCGRPVGHWWKKCSLRHPSGFGGTCCVGRQGT